MTLFDDLKTKKRGDELAQIVKPNTPTLRYMKNTSATEVAMMLRKNGRIIGLTRGQFSLIDLIYSVLQKTGPADVVVATWSAGIKDANTIKWMIDSDLIRSFLIVTDYSYKTRQAKYALSLTELFGEQHIRTSELHAKFVLIGNEDWKVTIRTSMNLNANRTCESFEMDEDAEVYGFYEGFIREVFGEMPEGFVTDYAVANRALDRAFDNLSSQFAWQTNE